MTSYKNIAGIFQDRGVDFSQPINDNLILDVDDSEALLIRKEGDLGDIFKVDTLTGKLCYTDGTEGVGKLLESDANGCATWVSPSASSGETNTASNQGGGQGLFKQKTGVDLEFYSLDGGTGITDTLVGDVVTLNLDNTGVTPATYGDSNSVGQITINQQGRVTAASNVDIDHDALTNFVANEHIDWTSTTSNFNTSGTMTLSGALQYTGATPTDGYVLTCNASGDATWAAPSGGGGGVTFSSQTLNTTYTSNTIPTPLPAVIEIFKFNNFVSVSVSDLIWVGTGSTGNVQTTTAIDVAYRPSIDKFFPMKARRRNSQRYGQTRIGTDGIITFFASDSLETFANDGDNEFYDGSFTYHV